MDKDQSYNYFHILTLTKLLSIGAMEDYVETTSTQISRVINRSQQTASKILIELENEGLIIRIKNSKRFKVRVTTKGYEIIKDIYEMIKNSMDKSNNNIIIFKGKIVTGMGEGSYYMSLEGYKSQFKSKLGYEPFPGTLNVKIDDKIYIDSRRQLLNYPSIYIKGFKNQDRTFGWVKCFPAIITKENRNKQPQEEEENKEITLNSHVLLLERTHHDNSLIEVISPLCIKDTADLKNGDMISIKVKNTITQEHQMS